MENSTLSRTLLTLVAIPWVSVMLTSLAMLRRQAMAIGALAKASLLRLNLLTTTTAPVVAAVAVINVPASAAARLVIRSAIVPRVLAARPVTTAAKRGKLYHSVSESSY